MKSAFRAKSPQGPGESQRLCGGVVGSFCGALLGMAGAGGGQMGLEGTGEVAEQTEEAGTAPHWDLFHSTPTLPPNQVTKNVPVYYDESKEARAGVT